MTSTGQTEDETQLGVALMDPGPGEEAKQQEQSVFEHQEQSTDHNNSVNNITYYEVPASNPNLNEANKWNKNSIGGTYLNET